MESRTKPLCQELARTFQTRPVTFGEVSGRGAFVPRLLRLWVRS